MTAEVDLLPLVGTLRALPEHVQGVVQAYGHANVAHATAQLQAEVEALRAEVDALRKALARPIYWIPSADTYLRLGFDPEAPMRVLEEARSALAQSEYHERNPKSGEE